MSENLSGGNNQNNNNGGGNGDRPSFIAILFQKLAFTMMVEHQTGKSTGAAQAEVHRQMGQVSKSQGGNYVTGEGATKSGGEE